MADNGKATDPPRQYSNGKISVSRRREGRRHGSAGRDSAQSTEGHSTKWTSNESVIGANHQPRWTSNESNSSMSETEPPRMPAGRCSTVPSPVPESPRRSTLSPSIDAGITIASPYNATHHSRRASSNLWVSSTESLTGLESAQATDAAGGHADEQADHKHKHKHKHKHNHQHKHKHKHKHRHRRHHERDSGDADRPNESPGEASSGSDSEAPASSEQFLTALQRPDRYNNEDDDTTNALLSCPPPRVARDPLWPTSGSYSSAEADDPESDGASEGSGHSVDAGAASWLWGQATPATSAGLYAGGGAPAVTAEGYPLDVVYVRNYDPVYHPKAPEDVKVFAPPAGKDPVAPAVQEGYTRGSRLGEFLQQWDMLAVGRLDVHERAAVATVHALVRGEQDPTAGARGIQLAAASTSTLTAMDLSVPYGADGRPQHLVRHVDTSAVEFLPASARQVPDAIVRRVSRQLLSSSLQSAGLGTAALRQMAADRLLELLLDETTEDKISDTYLTRGGSAQWTIPSRLAHLKLGTDAKYLFQHTPATPSGSAAASSILSKIVRRAPFRPSSAYANDITPRALTRDAGSPTDMAASSYDRKETASDESQGGGDADERGQGGGQAKQVSAAEADRIFSRLYAKPIGHIKRGTPRGKRRGTNPAVSTGQWGLDTAPSQHTASSPNIGRPMIRTSLSPHGLAAVRRGSDASSGTHGAQPTMSSFHDIGARQRHGPAQHPFQGNLFTPRTRDEALGRAAAAVQAAGVSPKWVLREAESPHVRGVHGDMLVDSPAGAAMPHPTSPAPSAASSADSGSASELGTITEGAKGGGKRKGKAKRGGKGNVATDAPAPAPVPAPHRTRDYAKPWLVNMAPKRKPTGGADAAAANASSPYNGARQPAMASEQARGKAWRQLYRDLTANPHLLADDIPPVPDDFVVPADGEDADVRSAYAAGHASPRRMQHELGSPSAASGMINTKLTRTRSKLGRAVFSGQKSQSPHPGRGSSPRVAGPYVVTSPMINGVSKAPEANGHLSDLREQLAGTMRRVSSKCDLEPPPPLCYGLLDSYLRLECIDYVNTL